MKRASRRRFTSLAIFLLIAISDIFNFHGDPFYVNARPVNFFFSPSDQSLSQVKVNLTSEDGAKFGDRGRAKVPLSIDLSNLSHLRAASNAEKPISQLSSTYMEEATLQKRGGKGMSRHLFAGAAAATMASATASLGMFSNSLKAHDQDKYGVSKKTGLQDKTKDKSSDGNNISSDKGSSDKDDDDDDGPDSPTYINNITYVNNIYLNAPPLVNTRRDADLENDDRIEGIEVMNIFKRGPKVVKAKGWHRYDHAAPIAEKIEDYGKMSAAAGALTAAVIMSYSALKAHMAYKHKATKGSKDDDDDDKKKKNQRRDLSSSSENDDHNGLVPSIVPSNQRQF